MTDRIHSFTVVLDHDIRDDDIGNIGRALALFHGVCSVKANVSSPIDVHVGSERRDALWRDALFDLLREGVVEPHP